MAGGDKAFEKMLERYDSPSAVAKGFRELRGKMDAGELKAPPRPLADNAKPEEVAAWRKENGLPENAAALVTGLKLPEGVVPGKQDQPLLNSFAELGVKANWNQETFNQAVDWYYQMSDQLSAQREEADGAFFRDSMTALQEEWGPKEFKANQNAVAAFVAMFPEDIRDQLLLARTPDGQILGDHPAFNRAALMMAKELNPAATILPNVGGGSLQAAEARIAEIETKHMRATQGSADWNAYWRSEQMQAEYRELVGARDKMKSRQAA